MTDPTPARPDPGGCDLHDLTGHHQPRPPSAPPGAPTARDVVLEALAYHLPGNGDVDRADLIVEALRAHGHIAARTDTPSDDELDDAAAALAEASRHPRYVQVADGWRRLREAEADVTLAYTAALRAAPSTEHGRLAGYRALLLDALDRRAYRAEGR